MNCEKCYAPGLISPGGIVRCDKHRVCDVCGTAGFSMRRIRRGAGRSLSAFSADWSAHFGDLHPDVRKIAKKHVGGIICPACFFHGTASVPRPSAPSTCPYRDEYASVCGQSVASVAGATFCNRHEPSTCRHMALNGNRCGKRLGLHEGPMFCAKHMMCLAILPDGRMCGASIKKDGSTFCKAHVMNGFGASFAGRGDLWGSTGGMRAEKARIPMAFLAKEGLLDEYQEVQAPAWAEASVRLKIGQLYDRHWELTKRKASEWKLAEIDREIARLEKRVIYLRKVQESGPDPTPYLMAIKRAEAPVAVRKPQWTPKLLVRLVRELASRIKKEDVLPTEAPPEATEDLSVNLVVWPVAGGMRSRVNQLMAEAEALWGRSFVLSMAKDIGLDKLPWVMYPEKRTRPDPLPEKPSKCSACGALVPWGEMVMKRKRVDLPVKRDRLDNDYNLPKRIHRLLEPVCRKCAFGRRSERPPTKSEGEAELEAIRAWQETVGKALEELEHACRQRGEFLLVEKRPFRREYKAKLFRRSEYFQEACPGMATVGAVEIEFDLCRIPKNVGVLPILRHVIGKGAYRTVEHTARKKKYLLGDSVLQRGSWMTNDPTEIGACLGVNVPPQVVQVLNAFEKGGAR